MNLAHSEVRPGTQSKSFCNRNIFYCNFVKRDESVSVSYYCSALIHFVKISLSFNPNHYFSEVFRNYLLVTRSHRLLISCSRAITTSIICSDSNPTKAYLVEAKSAEAQIVVFPEYGLYGPDFSDYADVYPYLEEIQVGINPCVEWVRNANPASNR